ncbi:MAG: hypothetical protein AB1441_03735 [Bacillota bacterium]
MMGYKRPQGKLFYQFSLDERVPLNHFLREVVKTVDFSFIYSLTRPFYSHTGTPSVDPVVVFKMALLSYAFGIPVVATNAGGIREQVENEESGFLVDLAT